MTTLEALRAMVALLEKPNELSEQLRRAVAPGYPKDGLYIKAAVALELQTSEIADLKTRLPCGHRKLDNDDGFGGCTTCELQRDEKKWRKAYEELRRAIELEEARDGR